MDIPDPLRCKSKYVEKFKGLNSGSSGSQEKEPAWGANTKAFYKITLPGVYTIRSECLQVFGAELGAYSLKCTLLRNKLQFIEIDNCGDEGGLVAKLIAAILGTVASFRKHEAPASGRAMEADHLENVAALLTAYYKQARAVGPHVSSSLPKMHIAPGTVIMGSSHEACLYLAFMLHAIYLPLSVTGYAKALEDTQF